MKVLKAVSDGTGKIFKNRPHNPIHFHPLQHLKEKENNQTLAPLTMIT